MEVPTRIIPTASVSSAMLILAIFYGFFEKKIHKEYISIEFDKFNVVHEEPEHTRYFRSHRSAWTVLYTSTCFLSVNRYIVVYIVPPKNLEWNISHNIIF